MEQNRQENITQKQNTHVHMHQVICGCPGGIYPTSGCYQTLGYNSPSSMMSYNYCQHLSQPYLQHYQYTQYNQYSMGTPQVAVGSGSVLYSNNQADLLFGKVNRERKEKTETKQIFEAEKPSESHYCDYGHVSPPPTKDILLDVTENNVSKNFVKFLERSCITAEQIAHRNRNRPCFRNIQNLCVRTRSEIVKPCTTISNIHSQGIPWATKDFIYAFVRLTNCWHILRGYWENRDGPAIGKISLELTPEFRDCYLRWERETMELAAQLVKVFYNLDTNSANQIGLANIPSPQVNLMKNTDSIKNSCIETASVVVQTPNIPVIKNTRGIIHLPVTPKKIDQSNQTCSKDFCLKSSENTDCSASDNNDYMKPGSYNVPMRTIANNTDTTFLNGSPRHIEFLETAQNINKIIDSNSIWSNNQPKKLKYKISKDDAEVPKFDVQKWLVTSHFSDYDNASSGSSSVPNMNQFYLDNSNPLSEIGIRQRNSEIIYPKKNTIAMIQKLNNRRRTLPPERFYNIKNDQDLNNGYRKNSDIQNLHQSTYDEDMGRLADAAVEILERIIMDLKSMEFADYLSRIDASNSDVNKKMREFLQRIQATLEARFSNIDFSKCNSFSYELASPLSHQTDNDGDHLN